MFPGQHQGPQRMRSEVLHLGCFLTLAGKALGNCFSGKADSPPELELSTVSFTCHMSESFPLNNSWIEANYLQQPKHWPLLSAGKGGFCDMGDAGETSFLCIFFISNLAMKPDLVLELHSHTGWMVAVEQEPTGLIPTLHMFKTCSKNTVKAFEDWTMIQSTSKVLH